MTQTQLANNVIEIRPMLLSVARKYAGNTHDAEDLVSETILKMFRSLHTYDDQQSFHGWAVVILKNAYIDSTRKNWNKQVHVEIQDYMKGTVADADRLLIYNEAMQLTNCLKDREREILVKYAIGYTYEELAKQWGLKLSAIKTTIHRARKKLSKVA